MLLIKIIGNLEQNNSIKSEHNLGGLPYSCAQWIATMKCDLADGLNGASSISAV